MRISDWSSDVCSSDLIGAALPVLAALAAVITGTAIPALVAFVVAMSPILLPAAAVAAAIVGIVLAVRHWDEISAIARRVYEGVKKWITDHLVDILNGLLHPIATVKKAFYKIHTSEERRVVNESVSQCRSG